MRVKDYNDTRVVMTAHFIMSIRLSSDNFLLQITHARDL